MDGELVALIVGVLLGSAGAILLLGLPHWRRKRQRRREEQARRTREIAQQSRALRSLAAADYAKYTGRRKPGRSER